MRTLVFILLLSISNAPRCPVCPSSQCCLNQTLGQCPTACPTPTPSPSKCLEHIHDHDCVGLFSGICCSCVLMGLSGGILIHKYCNCGKYCAKENSNANDQNDIGMQ
eukprot:16575_1